MLSLVALGLLAGCGDGILPASQAPYAPAAQLEPPWMAEPPLDPRFGRALTAYASALRELPRYEGAAFSTHLHATLRLLATAVALVPSSPAWREPAFRVANAIRSEVAQMETLHAEDPRAQLGDAGRALVQTADVLRALAERDYASSPDVVDDARRFVVAARAIGPDRPRAELIAALHAVEDVLQGMLRVAIETGG